MNFEQLLANTIIEEWKDDYVSYNLLIKEVTKSKTILFQSDQYDTENDKTCGCIRRVQHSDDTTDDIPNANIEITDILNDDTSTYQPFIDDDSDEKCDKKSKIIHHFEGILDFESKKVNKFFLSIEHDLQYDVQSITTKENIKHSEIYLNRIKLDIYLLYQKCVALRSYATFNRMAFEIITNKFKRELQCHIGDELCLFELEFVRSTKCKQYMNALVQLYADAFESGDTDKGKTHLFHSIAWANSRNQWKNKDSALFWMGTKFGIMIALIVCTGATILLTHAHDFPMLNFIYIYRGLGVLLTLIWFWSVDVYIYSYKRINFVFIFELNPNTRLMFLQCFDSAISLTIIYFANILLFIETYQHLSTEYSIIWPSSLFIFYILRLFLPIFRHWSTRKFLLNSILHCMIAPLGRVKFRDFFVGDVLTSLSKVFVDIYLSGCLIILHDYFGSTCTHSNVTHWIKPILICSPYWFRFMQCLNRYYVTGQRALNGFNALKYGLSLSVTLMGSVNSRYSKPDFDGNDDNNWDTGRIIWMCLSLLSAFYLIFWDIKMDWNLCPWKQRIKQYPIHWYYLAIIVDVILRFSWTFTLFPSHANPFFYYASVWEPLAVELFMWVIYALEVFRRCVWAVFRVEKAHNGQKEEFRTYEYVPVFFENTTLIQEKAEKQNKSSPLTMRKEVIAMCFLLVVIAVIISITGEE
eukprot:118156_1